MLKVEGRSAKFEVPRLGLHSDRLDVDECAAVAVAVELGDALLAKAHFAIYAGVNGPIFSHVCILSRAVPIAFLADQDLARGDHFTAKTFDATAFGNAVAPVLGRAYVP